MNDHTNDNTNPLHLHGDPEVERIESMLDALGQADRDAMPAHTHARMLEAVSGVFAPAPISIAQAEQEQTKLVQRSPAWKFRIAAAMFLATATTLGIVAVQPWSSGPTQPAPTDSTSTWSLASFEQDFDAYLALDEVGDDQLDEAVADWELWAQTIDTDVDASYLDQDLFGEPTDGAI